MPNEKNRLSTGTGLLSTASWTRLTPRNAAGSIDGSATPRSVVARCLETRRETKLIVGLYALAFVVRLLVGVHFGINSPFVDDAKEYFESAVLLSQGKGYGRLLEDGVVHPSAKRVPGTSLFLALGVLLIGKHEAAGRLTAIVVSSFSAPLMYRFALRVGTEVPARLAGLSCAFYPSWVFFSTTTLSEAFLIPLVLLSLLLTLRALELWTSRSALSAGLAWGVASLVRPITIPMAGMVALYLTRRSGWKRGMLLGAGFLLVVSPWVARNYFIFGRPLIATQGGDVFLGANNPFVVQLAANHGLWVNPLSVPEYRDTLKGAMGEVSGDNLEYTLAHDYLRKNPNAIPFLAIYKLERWLTPITETGGGVRILVLAPYGSLLLFLVFGVLRGIYRRSPALSLVVVWSLIQAAITVVYWGVLTRGRLLLELVWVPWACVAVWDLLASAMSWSSQRNSPSV